MSFSKALLALALVTMVTVAVSYGEDDSWEEARGAAPGAYEDNFVDVQKMSARQCATFELYSICTAQTECKWSDATSKCSLPRKLVETEGAYEDNFVDVAESVSKAPDKRWGTTLGCDLSITGFQEAQYFKANGAYKVTKDALGYPVKHNGKNTYHGPGYFGSMSIQYDGSGWVLLHKMDKVDKAMDKVFDTGAEDTNLYKCTTQKDLWDLSGLLFSCKWKALEGSSNPDVTVNSECCEPSADSCEAYKPVNGISTCSQYQVKTSTQWCTKNFLKGAFSCCQNDHAPVSSKSGPQCVYKENTDRPTCKDWN